MTAIRQLESAVEFQLQGLASPELASIVAELIVAALLFGGIGGAVMIGGWVLKRFASRTAAH